MTSRFRWTILIAATIFALGALTAVDPVIAATWQDGTEQGPAAEEPAAGEPTGEGPTAGEDPFADDGAEDDPFASPSGESSLLGDSPISLSIFGNLDFADATERGESSGFENGAIDLFITSQVTDRWSFLIELVLETEPETNEVVVDPERFRAAYDVSDRLRIELGRMHNGLVQWNVEHHHGLYMQTTASKPLISEWEDDGGLWPVHVVGLRVSGVIHEGFGFRYEATVANGRGETLDDIQVGGDLNSDKAVALSLGVAPPKLQGLQLMATGYRDEIPDPVGSLRELAYTLSARYEAHGFELRSEWSRLDHERETTGESFLTTGFYVLASYRLPGFSTSVRPYVLAERLDVAEGDSYFAGFEDIDAISAGVRWDMRPGVALKGEYRSEEVGSAASEERLRFQLAFGF